MLVVVQVLYHWWVCPTHIMITGLDRSMESFFKHSCFKMYFLVCCDQNFKILGLKLNFGTHASFMLVFNHRLLECVYPIHATQPLAASWGDSKNYLGTGLCKIGSTGLLLQSCFIVEKSNHEWTCVGCIDISISTTHCIVTRLHVALKFIRCRFVYETTPQWRCFGPHSYQALTSFIACRTKPLIFVRFNAWSILSDLLSSCTCEGQTGSWALRWAGLSGIQCHWYVYMLVMCGCGRQLVLLKYFQIYMALLWHIMIHLTVLRSRRSGCKSDIGATLGKTASLKRKARTSEQQQSTLMRWLSMCWVHKQGSTLHRLQVPAHF